MNYLAHIFLSGDNAQRKLGGFIADFVKGKHFEYFPEPIRQGIILHRQVDAFTDEHPLVREAIAMLRPQFGRYSGIFLDVFYDYYLAKNWRQFSKVSLLRFAMQFYGTLIWNYRWLPTPIKGFIWHFISTNRLCKYAKISGVQHALWIMGNYSSLPQMSHEAARFLHEHNEELEQNFMQFFPQLQKFVQEKLDEISYS